MSKKFELTTDTKIFDGKKLFRIRALIEFGDVKKGDLGGFVETDTNLSQNGNAWVYGDAQVYGNARVWGNAQVCGNAWVYGNAQVYGNARVWGNAQVCGNAWVYGNAWVCGNAQVYGNARVYGDAQVYGNARVWGNAQVCGNAWVYGNAQVSPINIISLPYNVTITDTHIKIGCAYRSTSEWESLSIDDVIDIYGKNAKTFFENYRDSILSMAKLHQVNYKM